MVQEKRRRTRVEVGAIEAQLTVHGFDDQPRTVPIHDLSLKGLSFPPLEGLEMGARCTITIAPGPGVLASIEAAVVRCDENSAALEFLEMDPDSFYHLRRLVQLHASDPDGIDRELTNPAFD